VQAGSKLPTTAVSSKLAASSVHFCSPGSQIQLEAEVTRLQSTLANLTATNAAAAAAVPAASDKGGQLLRIILEWRQQRQAAIEREVARLQQRLAVVTGKEQQQEISAEDKLVEWIKENGGQVGLCMRFCLSMHHDLN
jgi:hypothetical protein